MLLQMLAHSEQQSRQQPCGSSFLGSAPAAPDWPGAPWLTSALLARHRLLRDDAHAVAALAAGRAVGHGGRGPTALAVGLLAVEQPDLARLVLREAELVRARVPVQRVQPGVAGHPGRAYQERSSALFCSRDRRNGSLVWKMAITAACISSSLMALSVFE